VARAVAMHANAESELLYLDDQLLARHRFEILVHAHPQLALSGESVQRDWVPLAATKTRAASRARVAGLAVPVNCDPTSAESYKSTS
jgi:hypothetical protein